MKHSKEHTSRNLSISVAEATMVLKSFKVARLPGWMTFRHWTRLAFNVVQKSGAEPLNWQTGMEFSFIYLFFIS